jgi:hypothetical protein
LTFPSDRQRIALQNTFNHPQWGLPNMAAWNSSNQTPPATFASISTTATDMRQIQLALKYTF